MRNVSFKLAACLLVFVAAASPAAADDAKNYPGLACLASGTAITNIERSSSTGRAHNPTTGDMTFVCPGVRDHTNHAISSAKMYVLDQRPDRSISCVLRSGYPGGAAQWYSTNATTAAFYSSVPAELPFAGISATSLGFYWFSCAVPGLNTSGLPSGIAMYQIDENS